MNFAQSRTVPRLVLFLQKTALRTFSTTATIECIGHAGRQVARYVVRNLVITRSNQNHNKPQRHLSDLMAPRTAPALSNWDCRMWQSNCRCRIVNKANSTPNGLWQEGKTNIWLDTQPKCRSKLQGHTCSLSLSLTSHSVLITFRWSYSAWLCLTISLSLHFLVSLFTPVFVRLFTCLSLEEYHWLLLIATNSISSNQ